MAVLREINAFQLGRVNTFFEGAQGALTSVFDGVPQALKLVKTGRVLARYANSASLAVK